MKRRGVLWGDKPGPARLAAVPGPWRGHRPQRPPAARVASSVVTALSSLLGHCCATNDHHPSPPLPFVSRQHRPRGPRSKFLAPGGRLRMTGENRPQTSGFCLLEAVGSDFSPPGRRRPSGCSPGPAWPPEPEGEGARPPRSFPHIGPLPPPASLRDGRAVATPRQTWKLGLGSRPSGQEAGGGAEALRLPGGGAAVVSTQTPLPQPVASGGTRGLPGPAPTHWETFL